MVIKTNKLITQTKIIIHSIKSIKNAITAVIPAPTIPTIQAHPHSSGVQSGPWWRLDVQAPINPITGKLKNPNKI